MGDKPVLRSGARGPVVRKAALAGAVGAGIIFFGLPALGALAPAPKTVSYVCVPTPSMEVPPSPDLSVTLGGPASATPSQAVTLSWSNSQSNDTNKQIKAVAEIPTTDRIVMIGELVITGPAANVTATVTATSTYTPPTKIVAGAPLPFPTISATVTPTVAGTLVAKAEKFTLQVVSAAAGGGGGVMYICTIGTAGANIAPAEASVTVTPAASSSSSPSPSPSPSATPSATPTPRHTKTVYETVTLGASPKPKKKGQVNTPDGGVSTGGGGEAGPDARVLILTGAGLMLAAAAGGLVLRTRRRAVRQ
ncbi:hypothetical protein [Sphaerimonospora thailandensis]|uniref:Uncharacterized protein n=1 Tax=Sphaerimonospora thailandensis TaxID=795644 RepID=A0A8J3VZ73_9ACTN|nr:hypothetical protein [Sphaerimonospora thailandensis]GIH69601.1 hypothetical protein Mth01_18540 [Sphaerimonospora thailandensis]